MKSNNSEPDTSITEEVIGNYSEIRKDIEEKISQINENVKKNTEMLTALNKIEKFSGINLFNPKTILVRDGDLIKCSGGKSEKYYFLLTNEMLYYFKRVIKVESSVLSKLIDDKLTLHHEIPLNSILVR